MLDNGQYLTASLLLDVNPQKLITGFPLLCSTQFYWNQTQQSESRKTKPFLVVRQEHLQDDMNGLEAFLRKSTTSNEGSSLTKWRRADSEHFTTGRVSRTVSQDCRRNLCCALEDEFHVYNLMIAHSENLDPLAKQETSQEVLRVCSVGAWEELDCPPWSTWEEHSTPSFLRLTLYVSLLEWSTIILLFEFKMSPFDNYSTETRHFGENEKWGTTFLLSSRPVNRKGATTGTYMWGSGGVAEGQIDELMLLIPRLTDCE